MLSAIIACLLGAILTPAIKRLVGKHYHYALSLIPLSLFAIILEQATWLAQTKGSAFALLETYQWIPSLNISLSLRGDGLSFLLAGLITGVGTFISIYAGTYLKDHLHGSRFYVYFFIFMAAMLGISFSDNFYAFFVFWELTGVASFFLIGFDFQQKSSRANALQALLVTGIGGLCLLAGFVLTHHALGTATFSYLNQHASEIQNHPWFVPILILFFLGALTKSAQFPFHFWLPNAMSAPTPASAYLHSATMVKAGIFLLARIAPAFDSYPPWSYTLITVGSITTLIAAALSFFQYDLKKILAYTTLGSLGILTLSLGIGTPLVVKSALVFMVAHAFYKASLFLIAGIIDHETGTRDIRKLSGLASSLPITTVAVIMAGIAMIGLPPSLSFIGKETLLTGILNYKWGPLWATILAIAAISFVFAGVYMISIFVSGNKDDNEKPKDIHEAHWSLWIGPMIMGFIGLSVPFFATWFDSSITNPAYDTFLKPSFEYQMTFWHGFSWPLFISIFCIGFGYWIFTYCKTNADDLIEAGANIKAGPAKVYEFLINAIGLYSGPVFRLFQSGSLRFYLHVILWSFVSVVLAFLILNFQYIPTPNILSKPTLSMILVQLIIACGVVMCLIAKRIFTSILSLSFVGFGIAIVYTLHGAPDLAMTQLMVETLTLILLVLVLRKMPVSANLLLPNSKIFSVSLSVAFGLVFVAITYISSTTPLPSSVSEFYAATSLIEAKGRNIVNVILVDYRGFDTLGEIFVLALASLGVFTLLKSQKSGERS